MCGEKCQCEIFTKHFTKTFDNFLNKTYSYPCFVSLNFLESSFIHLLQPAESAVSQQHTAAIARCGRIGAFDCKSEFVNKLVLMKQV